MMEGGEGKHIQASNDLPEEVKLFSHQVSGHKHGQGRLAMGVLKHQDGDILKPLFEGDRRAVIELSFYENIFQTCQSEPVLQELAHFLPAFHGICEINVAGKDNKYLRLEDVSENFKNPSVLDIKMGCRTYDDDANEAKIRSQSKKYLTGGTLGIRIQGMKVFSDENNAYLSQIDKMFWKQLTPDAILSGLEMYLTNNRYVNCLVLSGFIHKLLRLNDWFSIQRRLKFIGSSLLFVYEGTVSSWMTWAQNNEISVNSSSLVNSQVPDTLGHTKCNSYLSDDNTTLTTCVADACNVCGFSKSICTKLLTNCSLFCVKMIDFTHSSPSEEEDTNYTFGLHKLISYLKDLLKMQIEKL